MSRIVYSTARARITRIAFVYAMPDDLKPLLLITLYSQTLKIHCLLCGPYALALHGADPYAMGPYGWGLYVLGPVLL